MRYSIMSIEWHNYKDKEEISNVIYYITEKVWCIKSVVLFYLNDQPPT